MAHVAKFGKGAMGHIMAHYDRSKECDDNVDKERTHMNYNLAAHQQLTQLQFIHKRLSEVQVHNRKDVNVMCDWVVTAPKDFLAEHSDKEREFFEAAYRFLEQKYGKENVISAYVHKDEATPHMHFAFVPVVYDEKKDRYKVSAKECITRADLKVFHQELEQYVSQELQLEVRLQNGATSEGNVTVPQLRAQQERADQLAEENELLRSRIIGLNEQIRLLEDDLKRTQKALSDVKEPYEVVKAYGQIKPFMGHYKASEADKLLQKHLAFEDAQKELKEVKQTLESVRKDKEFMEHGYQEEVARLEERVAELEQKVEELTPSINYQLELNLMRSKAREYDKLLQKVREYEKQLGISPDHTLTK